MKLARSSAIVLVLALAAVLNSGWVWSGAAMQLGRYGLWACLTVFLSAFLLFQVQPSIGNAILPWFGGSASVWNTCMLFFQSLLVAGYAYAHWLGGRWPIHRQAIVHFAVVSVAMVTLPIIPRDSWAPEDGCAS